VTDQRQQEVSDAAEPVTLDAALDAWDHLDAAIALKAILHAYVFETKKAGYRQVGKAIAHLELPEHVGGLPGSRSPETLREELEGPLQRLEELERWIKESAGDNNRERVRADAVAVAIEHVRQAIDALELEELP
jgi:hypothetical protein